ncbi:ABC transporter permease [Streptacidiphilus sp. ASG 303]|uniref:ABC transporter permease n=1 Tax=Streptacidiphilus sp. ASG 303 TaxID=2896847 RepID=UPI001E2AF381|nr:FtsX-like permease family protein [Streptacidiphilus sp. ASG 303]MCD0481792.1 ABC transporter permease [Streptacidiphilus sp. ASG 303]
MMLRTSLRNLLAHKGRVALSLVAVVLSVSFVSGTLVFADTATATFDRLFASTAADVSVSPKGAGSDDDRQYGGARAATLPDSVVRRVAAQPGVRSAAGDVSVQDATVVDPATGKAIGPTGGAPTIAGNWYETPNPALRITSGRVPHGPGEAVLDADTAGKAGLGTGDALRVVTPFGDHRLTISGVATFTTTNPGAALVFFDTPTAQRYLLGRTGVFTSVAAYGDGSRSDDRVKAEVTAELGPSYTVRTAAESAAQAKVGVGGFLDFMKYAMLGFAGISLLVGAFLIVNTFSMLVAQRTREIGLLRAVGGSRAQVNRSVLAEALLLGLLGSTLGLAAGLGLAVGLVRLIGSLGMHLDASELSVRGYVPAVAYAIGVVVTVLAAWLPARRASRISPMAALRDHGTPAEPSAHRVRAAVGLVLTAAGAAALAGAAASHGGAAGGSLLGLGVVLTLVGFVVAGPLLAAGVVRVLGAALPALFGPAGTLAQRNALRNPRRTGATAAALMIGLALVTGASVVTSSMVSSASSQIDRSVGADYVVRSASGALPPQVVRAVTGTSGLDHVSRQKQVPATVTTPDGRSTETGVNAVSPTYARDLRVPAASGDFGAALTRGISVDQGFADAHRLKVGDPLKVAFRGGATETLPVAAVTADDSELYKGQLFVGLAVAERALPADRLPLDVMLLAAAAPGADTGKVYADLQKSLADYPQVQVKDQADYKALIRKQVDQLLSMVYGLLGLAIVVAVLGVVNTLALSVVERTREIGLLRALGLSRRQLRRMVRLESVVIAVFGAVLGTGLGLAWGTAAQRVLESQGLDLLTVPVGTIAAVFAGAALVGLLAALGPAFRASRMNVLAAIATD